MEYWLLSYGHSGWDEEEIIQYLWDLNLEYVDCNCRCELVCYQGVLPDREVVDMYVLFGNDHFFPKHLHKEIYPGYECSISSIDEATARKLCFPYLEERGEEGIEEINYRVDRSLSVEEADLLYDDIRNMYYIPRLESWASKKIRKFYEDRQKKYIQKNSAEFQKAYEIFTAKAAMLEKMSGRKLHEPFVVEKDGQIVYYGSSRSWFTDPSEDIAIHFFPGGNHRIERSAYTGTGIKHVRISGGGRGTIGRFAFSECLHLEEFSVGDSIEIEDVEIPSALFTDCSRLNKVQVPEKLKRIFEQQEI